MKTIISPEPGKVCLGDIPVPTPDPYEALVKIEACAICNHTDMMFVNREFGGPEGGGHPEGVPINLGHESAGVVIALGEKCRNFKVGDRVLRAHTWGHYPGGIGSEGGMSEYGVVQDLKAIQEDGVDIPLNYQCTKHQILPEGINSVQGAIMITLKETWQTLRNFDIKPGEPLGIVGTGPVAVCFTKFAKIMGASPIIVFGRRADHEKKFKGAGADMYVVGNDFPQELKDMIANGGIGKVIEAVGSDSALKMCLDVVGEKGTVQLYGAAPGLSWAPELRNDPRVWVKWPDEEDANEEMAQLVLDGKVNPYEFISHVLQPEDCEFGFEQIKSHKATKVVFLF